MTQAAVTAPTLAEVEVARAQLRIARSTWDRMKIQAIHEGLTAEQLAARIFEEYLASPSAEAARKN